MTSKMTQEILTFKRASPEHRAAHAPSPELLSLLRRVLERDPSMAAPARPWPEGEPLTREEQLELLAEIMLSVDENAHRRGRANLLESAGPREEPFVNREELRGACRLLGLDPELTISLIATAGYLEATVFDPESGAYNSLRIPIREGER